MGDSQKLRLFVFGHSCIIRESCIKICGDAYEIQRTLTDAQIRPMVVSVGFAVYDHPTLNVADF